MTREPKPARGTSVRLTLESLEALDALAERERRTRNFYVQVAIDRFLAAENPKKTNTNKK